MNPLDLLSVFAIGLLALSFLVYGLVSCWERKKRVEERTSNTFQDPIVEEIHRIREKLLEEHGGDFEALMDHLRSQQAESGHRVISPPDER